ncbi:TIGR03986 family type III CRISPR-associated RAMP protein [Actinomadura flavalba]|uniref:TIGR03986 family type III CRISPR-associated RAMP protein n=1 Tax=Actinomadura flavalba TaxID=1120938 RepID=UPI00035F3EB1|nr:TIGR03986 family CRISPR-associated RAMP protein [Actinomadura flavalba]
MSEPTKATPNDMAGLLRRPKPPPPGAKKGPGGAEARAPQHRTGPPETFLNPYTFVPAFPRTDATGAFGDAAPPSGSRLHDDHWTGEIDVSLTVRTPLLLLDTAAATPVNPDGHRTYPVLLRDGRPHLPATALKGMLRAAYETITNSRFGIFTGHEERPAWRRAAADAAHMYPIRVIDKGRRLEVWESHWMPFYLPGGGPGDIRWPHPPEHGARVWIELKQGEVADVEPHTVRRPGGHWTEAYVFRTGRNVEGKTKERAFVRPEKPRTVKLTDELRRQWDDLMRYHAAERAVAVDDALDVSAHRTEGGDDRRTLAPDSFCWGYLPDKRTVEALYPVLVPRELAAAAPAAQVPEGVEPAIRYDGLSPADRVFGWVAGDGSGTRPAAHRGRLRVRDVTCRADPADAVVRFGRPGLPLAILAQPKPAQARFYLADNEAKPDRPITPGTEKKDVYLTPGRTLRGRKVYWHHRLAAQNAEYWNADGSTQERVGGVLYREYRRPREPVLDDAGRPKANRDGTAFQTTGAEQRDKQNRSIQGWIAQDTEFTLTLDVRDLHPVELGALIWLLTLPEDEHHRLGLGKSLGFGSVHLKITGTRLGTRREWAEYYRLLTPPPAVDAADHCLNAFLAEARDQPGFTVIEAAFRAAARGRELPVHYPRTRTKAMHGDARTPPSPAGESYAWFTANEKMKDGAMARGRGRSLPRPHVPEDDDLPVYRADD